MGKLLVLALVAFPWVGIAGWGFRGFLVSCAAFIIILVLIDWRHPRV